MAPTHTIHNRILVCNACIRAFNMRKVDSKPSGLPSPDDLPQVKKSYLRQGASTILEQAWPNIPEHTVHDVATSKEGHSASAK